MRPPIFRTDTRKSRPAKAFDDTERAADVENAVLMRMRALSGPSVHLLTTASLFSGSSDFDAQIHSGEPHSPREISRDNVATDDNPVISRGQYQIGDASQLKVRDNSFQLSQLEPAKTELLLDGFLPDFNPPATLIHQNRCRCLH